jgi:hypothetical protein
MDGPIKFSSITPEHEEHESNILHAVHNVLQDYFVRCAQELKGPIHQVTKS